MHESHSFRNILQKKPSSRSTLSLFSYYLLAAVQWFERIIAFLVLLGVTAATIFNIKQFFTHDWLGTAPFYNMLAVVLMIIIGLELIRMLVLHQLIAILELLAFIIARKMLSPELSAHDLLLGVIAFILLVAVRYLIVKNKKTKNSNDIQSRAQETHEVSEECIVG